jgi:deoxyadenosine/deoxycytidine kinase
MTKIINLFAGPGAGKSTLASGLFYKMKQLGYNAEYVPEYAKDLTYEKRHGTLRNQVYILGKQFNRIERLVGQVKYIITDSPLLFSAFYADGTYPPSFFELCNDLHNKYDTMNYFVNRVKKYSPVGRNQTEDEAKQIDVDLLIMLHTFDVKYKIVSSDDNGVTEIMNDV